MSYFFDTSAVVKRYVVEAGSGWVNGIIRSAVISGERVQLSSLTRVELVAAIARRRRGGTISPVDASLILGQFRRELSRVFRSVALTYQMIGTAMDLAEKHALRGYDAAQLSSALARFPGGSRQDNHP